MLRLARAVESGLVCEGHVGCSSVVLVDMKTEFQNMRGPVFELS